MIEGGGLGVFRPEEVGPIDVQVPNGVVDLPVEDEAEAVAVAKKYLGFFQGPLAKLRVGLCSMELSGVRPGNDPGKGLQLAEEPWGVGETPFSVELEKLDVECLGNPATGARYGVLLVQEYARDAIHLGSEIYWQRSSALDSLGDNFQVTLYTNGRPADYGVVSGTRPNRVLTARTSSGITGAVRERPSGAPKFVPRAMLGM